MRVCAQKPWPCSCACALSVLPHRARLRCFPQTHRQTAALSRRLRCRCHRRACASCCRLDLRRARIWLVAWIRVRICVARPKMRLDQSPRVIRSRSCFLRAIGSLMIVEVEVEVRGAIGTVEAGTVMGDALYVRALLVQGCAHVRLTLRHRRVALTLRLICVHLLPPLCQSNVRFPDACASLGRETLSVRATICCLVGRGRLVYYIQCS